MLSLVSSPRRLCAACFGVAGRSRKVARSNPGGFKSQNSHKFQFLTRFNQISHGAFGLGGGGTDSSSPIFCIMRPITTSVFLSRTSRGATASILNLGKTRYWRIREACITESRRKQVSQSFSIGVCGMLATVEA